MHTRSGARSHAAPRSAAAGASELSAQVAEGGGPSTGACALQSLTASAARPSQRDGAGLGAEKNRGFWALGSGQEGAGAGGRRQ